MGFLLDYSWGYGKTMLAFTAGESNLGVLSSGSVVYHEAKNLDSTSVFSLSSDDLLLLPQCIGDQGYHFLF